MPVIQGFVDVLSAQVADNILSGSQYEYLPWPALLEFGLNGDVNGIDLRIDAYSGSDVLAENVVPSSQARIPIYPDDFLLTDVASAGERIKVRVRNVGLATRRLFFSVRITPAAK